MTLMRTKIHLFSKIGGDFTLLFLWFVIHLELLLLLTNYMYR